MVVTVVYTLLWSYLLVKSNKTKSKKHSKKQKKKNSSLNDHKLILGPGSSCYDLLQLERRSSQLLHHLHTHLLQLNRQQWGFEQTVQAFTIVIGQALLVLLISLWVALLSEEQAVITVGVLIAIIVIVKLFQDSKKKVQQRKQAILLELPIMLTRLTLLVGAGETVQQAFMKSIVGKEGSKNPLHIEWNNTVHEIRNGASFLQSIEKLNRNCAVQQIAVFTTILLLNYRRGGEQFVTAVQDISLSLWETRKNMARVRGEEASAKLIFPLVGVLLLVMILIITPAILFMQFL
ncbi:MAG: type II secretion system F family protein [Candidatus Pristimantibacillus lignocellulolyticus]|uniref:Type II secretion system F family protein n=1 Tax=Candidatus Pristimantibacillus lignocellulolyticus TaxID=2994561 RepID=A0A9J6ZL30_9BACL|nr:MAG: type II secretion system F family protein [Candidatus Pristimantibacillus lignocellulolyticus]